MTGLVVDLSDALIGAGGKARGLAQLVGAGVDVPAGFAISGDAFRAVLDAAGAPDAPGPVEGGGLDEIGHVLGAWARAAEEAELPPALEAEVLARARALGGLLIVRSSMAVEDGAHGAAPGLGRSVARVAPGDVWRAIRAVWAASVTPLVAVYAQNAGSAAFALSPPGVVVQRFVEGAACTIFTRPPGRPDADELWISTGDGPPDRRPRTAAETATGEDPRIALALAAERAIGAARGADVELIGDGARWIVVQARPLVHPWPQGKRTPAPELVLAPLRAAGGVWRRDVTHNPEPMSVAQTGLCERVERAGVAPFHLKVVAGFLYSTPRADAAIPAPITAAELETAYALAAAEVDQILAAVEDAPLAEVLDAYVEAYRVLTAELAPVIAAAREATRDLGAYVTRRPSSIGSTLARAARGELGREALLDIVGDSAPAWDVVAPTFAERPALLDEALARAAARPAPPEEPAVPDELADRVALARAAADVAERDDLLFARAQAAVRRVLLTLAAAAGLAPDDVFWLPLDELVAGIAGEDHLRRAAGRAAAARAAAARAAAWDLPLTVGATPEPTPDLGEGGWQGSGLGGRTAGPVARLASLNAAALVRRGSIVVTAAITPAMALLIEGAAAIVCEHGSLLDHGAAMARELGIPCVVGCAGIVDALADGDWVEVDGDAGRVTRA